MLDLLHKFFRAIGIAPIEPFVESVAQEIETEPENFALVRDRLISTKGYLVVLGGVCVWFDKVEHQMKMSTMHFDSVPLTRKERKRLLVAFDNWTDIKVALAI